MLGPRLAVAALALPPLVLLAYLGGWPLCLLLVAAAVLGVLEVRGIFAGAGARVFWPVAGLAAVLLVLDAQWPGRGISLAALAGAVLAGLVWAVLREAEPRQVALGWAATLAAPL